MKRERERYLNFDLLRILSMLMIVCFHYCIHGNGEQIFSTSFSIQQVISYTFGSWGLVGVTCFFMISAWFMQNRETISISKWLNLYVKVVIVFLMCLLIAKGLGENIIARTLLEAILSPLNSSYWYVTAYMVMMFFVPSAALPPMPAAPFPPAPFAVRLPEVSDSDLGVVIFFPSSLVSSVMISVPSPCLRSPA